MGDGNAEDALEDGESTPRTWSMGNEEFEDELEDGRWGIEDLRTPRTWRMGNLRTPRT